MQALSSFANAEAELVPEGPHLGAAWAGDGAEPLWLSRWPGWSAARSGQFRRGLPPSPRGARGPWIRVLLRPQALPMTSRAP